MPRYCEGATNYFVCEYPPGEVVKGSKKFTYGIDSLPKDSLHIWWKKDSRENKSWNNGSIVKWKIENKFSDVEIRCSTLSGLVETPGFGGQYVEEVYHADRHATFILQLLPTLH